MVTIFDLPVVSLREIECEIDLLEIELEDILKDYDSPEDALRKCGSERESLGYLVDLLAFSDLIQNYTNSPTSPLINENFFHIRCEEDYKSLNGGIDWNAVPFCYIDWIAVSEELKHSYYEIEFGDSCWFLGR